MADALKELSRAYIELSHCRPPVRYNDRDEGGLMNGDDITSRNESIPWFPKSMPLWQRVLCLLGYHKRETRQSAPGHCYGVQTEEGKRRGIFGIHDETPMKLRDQCGRCRSLL